MNLTDLERLPDRDLIAALRVLQLGIDGDEATFALLPAETTALTAVVDAGEGSVDTLDAKRVEMATARGDRDNTRQTMIDLARDLLKRARQKVGNDPEKLAKIGLDVYDETKTSAPAPESTPFALIDFGILRHTIKFRDSATPDKRGKPAGMLGVEIWSKIGGPPPAADSDYSMVALDTSSPHIVSYPLTDKGKQVWYRMRWVTTTGEKGGWGEVVEATING